MSLRVAGVVLVAQGAGLMIAGVVELVAALVGHPHDRGTATLLGAVTVIYAAIVLAVGRGLLRRKAWAGTPAFMVEFFAVIIGVGQIHTLTALSVALLVSAVVAVAALVHPDSRAVLIRDR